MSELAARRKQLPFHMKGNGPWFQLPLGVRTIGVKITKPWELGLPIFFLFKIKTSFWFWSSTFS